MTLICPNLTLNPGTQQRIFVPRLKSFIAIKEGEPKTEHLNRDIYNLCKEHKLSYLTRCLSP
jgi:hypothetical protein